MAGRAEERTGGADDRRRRPHASAAASPGSRRRSKAKPKPAKKPDAAAALHRVDLGPGAYGDDYAGFDMLLYVNLTDGAIEAPVMGAAGSDFSRALLSGGWQTDPAFGGGGPSDLDTLGAGRVYATLIPSATTDASLGFEVDGEERRASDDALGNGDSLYLRGFVPPQLSVGGATVTEGDSGSSDARFTVRIPDPAKRAVTVDYATEDGRATAGSDYTAKSGTLTIPVGRSSATIRRAGNG